MPDYLTLIFTDEFLDCVFALSSTLPIDAPDRTMMYKTPPYSERRHNSQKQLPAAPPNTPLVEVGHRLIHQQAAIGVEVSALNVASMLGGQEDYGGGDLLGLAKAP